MTTFLFLMFAIPIGFIAWVMCISLCFELFSIFCPEKFRRFLHWLD